MNCRVVFSGEGFDHTAHFDNSIDCDFFARLMANNGRLLRVIVDGLDLTEKYVTVIKLN